MDSCVTGARFRIEAKIGFLIGISADNKFSDFFRKKDNGRAPWSGRPYERMDMNWEK